MNSIITKKKPVTTASKTGEDKPEKPNSKNEALSKLGVGYTAKAGGHLVCAELLFRGFNASMVSVDVGVDIVATKSSRLFNIQVKTANLNNAKAFGFDIGKSAFERHDAGNVFYVFVLRGKKETNYLVMPFHEMEKKVKEKAIFLVGNNPRYRVNLRMRPDGVFLGSRDHSIGYYLNNWTVIK